MASDWQPVTLDDLVEVKHGFAFQGEYFQDRPPGDVLLTPGNFAIGGGFKGDKLKYYRGPVQEDYVLSEGDLLVTMTDLSRGADTLGYPALVPQSEGESRYLHNQRLGKVLIRPNAPVEKRFLYYVLCWHEYRNEVIASATGTTVKHTSPTRIGKFKFLLPDVDEQRAIANVLGTLDDKIHVNEESSQTAEKIARSLFTSWFVDFDPVRAKLEGHEEGLPRHIADLFPNSFEESEIGAIPAGWKTGHFGDVVELLREQENPADSPETMFDHYSIPAFDNGQRPKPELGSEIKSLKSKVPQNVILLSKLNPEIERVWLVDVQGDDHAICSTEFLVLRAHLPFGQSYVYCLARSSLFRTQIQALVTGTSKSHQRAQADSILKLPVVIPPPSLVQRFETYVASFLLRTLSGRRESGILGAIRETLLPRLISGEIRIPSLETILGGGD